MSVSVGVRYVLNFLLRNDGLYALSIQVSSVLFSVLLALKSTRLNGEQLTIRSNCVLTALRLRALVIVHLHDFLELLPAVRLALADAARAVLAAPPVVLHNVSNRDFPVRHETRGQLCSIVRSFPQIAFGILANLDC